MSKQFAQSLISPMRWRGLFGLVCACAIAVGSESDQLANYFHQIENSTYPRSKQLLADAWRQVDPRTVDLAHEIPVFQDAIKSGNQTALEAALEIALQILRVRADEESTAQFKALAPTLREVLWKARSESLIVNGERQPLTNLIRAKSIDLMTRSGVRLEDREVTWAAKTVHQAADDRITLMLVDSLGRSANQGTDAVSALVEAARSSPRAAIRGHAIDSLIHLGQRSNEVEGAVLAGLSDPDAHVRAQAATAAGQFRILGAVAKLQILTPDPAEDVRREATNALSKVKVPVENQ